MLAALAFLALEVSPARAGTLASVTWWVSNPHASATGVIYAFSFTTATLGTIKSVTMTVPSGTAGTIAVGTVYGVGAGTVALVSNTITHPITTAMSVPAGPYTNTITFLVTPDY